MNQIDRGAEIGYHFEMHRCFIALFAFGSANAAPAKVAYDKLFRTKASWTLPCVETRNKVSRSLGDLVCTIDATSRDGNAKRAHLICSGLTEPAEDTDLGQAFIRRTFVATADALWSVDDPSPLVGLTKTPALLAAHPKAGVRRANSGDKDTCCTTANAPCEPCPPEYSGVEYTTAALDKSWCVRSHPWGTGGAPSATVVCLSSDGELTGVASYKRESDTADLRCGATIDPAP